MGWLFGRKKADAAGNVDEEGSVPDYAVPDVETPSQRLVVPVVTKKNPSWGKRFCAEVNPRQSWFQVTDPVNGRVLDIPESFAPASCVVFLWKSLYCATCVGTMVYAMINSPAYFFFAYLTNWGILWCSLYAILSLLNTVVAARTGQPAADKAVGMRIRSTWILFTLASNTSAVAALLFWPLVYKPGNTVTYLTVAPHGVLLILTCIDGFFVNRIPLRLMHWYGVLLPFDFCFVCWTLIHDFLHLGNPDNNDNNPPTNDDSLYVGVIEWSMDWQKSLIWSVITIFAIGPAIYCILWTISIGCWCSKDPRKYVDTVDERDDRPTVDDVQEGSVFAKWR